MNIDTLVLVILYFLPAILANSSPPVFIHLGFLRSIFIPISIKLLGKNKTWGGLICGVGIAIITSMIQKRGYVVGFWLGAGALGGDLIKSFFKRKAGIKEGRYIPFDTIDWIVGTFLVAFIYEFNLNGSLFVNYFFSTLKEDPWLILTVPSIFILGTAIANYLGYRLKIKRSI